MTRGVLCDVSAPPWWRGVACAGDQQPPTPFVIWGSSARGHVAEHISTLTERGKKNGATSTRVVVGGGTGHPQKPSSPRSVSVLLINHDGGWPQSCAGRAATPKETR